MKQTNLLSHLHEGSQVERGRHSGIRQGLADTPVADYQELSSAPRPADDAHTIKLKAEYEQALQLTGRESAMLKLLAVLWRAEDPHRPPNQAQIIGIAAGYVCDSGCPVSMRESLRQKGKAAMTNIQKLQRVGPDALAEEISISMQGLNEILNSPHDAIDFNYYNYLTHFAYLLNTEIGPLFLMKSILKKAGPPRKEGDMSCDKNSECSFTLHNTNITGYEVRTALREYQQLQLHHWSRVKAPQTLLERDQSIIDHYRFAPNTVLQVHAQSERFDDLLCPYVVASEREFGRQRANEELTSQSMAFAGRVSFWLAAGIGGFGGMIALTFFGAALPFGAILTIATALMTLVTPPELFYRMRLANQKAEDARRVHQAIVSGNSSSERVHMWAYMLEHIQSEKRTAGFVMGYELATLAAVFGLAKLFVRIIPKNYSNKNQVIRLVELTDDSKFKTFLLSKYGMKNRMDIFKVWPGLSTAARSEIILQARAARFHRHFFFPAYFAKEMYDAWELYPRVIPGPGSAPISCPREATIFRDPRCYSYCESRANVFETNCVDL